MRVGLAVLQVGRVFLTMWQAGRDKYSSIISGSMLESPVPLKAFACNVEVRGAGVRLPEIEVKDKEFASCGFSGASKLVHMEII